MARRIAQTTLNASTIDILNVIRQNAPYDYQQSVPPVTKASDIPKVGEVIYGTPETMVYEEGTDGESGYLRVKSFSTDSQDDGFYVEVERRDITQHTLDNFVEV